MDADPLAPVEYMVSKRVAIITLRINNEEWRRKSNSAYYCWNILWLSTYAYIQVWELYMDTKKITFLKK